jgi:hypothetical protein
MLAEPTKSAIISAPHSAAEALLKLIDVNRIVVTHITERSKDLFCPLLMAEFFLAEGRRMS